jgi:hypothetical protein
MMVKTEGHKMQRWFSTLVVAIAAFAGSARAQDAPIGFQSPSHNIHCQYFTGDTQNVVRCDVMEGTVTAPRPRDCDLE